MLGQGPLFCGRQIKKISLEKEDIFYIIAVIQRILRYEIVCAIDFFGFILRWF
jgi:hypothetical protein